MSRLVSRSEADRLGKRGSYRLGALGQQGVGRPEPPRPFRPYFTRPYHAGPTSAWVLAALGGTAAIAAGAAAGWWFVPFAAGLAAGLLTGGGGWRLRVCVPAVIVMAAAGWGVALWLLALRGLPVGATARTIAGLAGAAGLPALPASAAAMIALTLAISIAQALSGLWLGRACVPTPQRD